MIGNFSLCGLPALPDPGLVTQCSSGFNKCQPPIFCLSLAGLISQILISLYKTGEHWERSHSNWTKLQLIGTTSTGIFSIICLNNAPRCDF